MMKSFRNIALSALLTVGAFSAVTYTACNKDACKDVVCQNGGVCANGVCTCATGYEGTNCETKSTTKFIGQWSASDVCNGGSPDVYIVTIAQDPSAVDKVLVSNLGNYGCTTGGTISWNGSVNALTLTINDSKCNYQFNATGTYNAATKSVSFNYTAKYATITDNCTATLTK